MSSHPPLTPIGSALAGALGAVFSNTLVYPLDTVKTRLQASPPADLKQSDTNLNNIISEHTRKRPRSLGGTLVRKIRQWQMLSLLLRILKTEGVKGAFKGFSANMINTFAMQFAYFFFHTLLRNTALRRLSLRSSSTSQSLSTTSELLLGALAGAFAQIFTIPVAVIATRQQLYLPPRDYPTQPAPSLFETAREIVDESGPMGLWTGLKPGLVLTVNPAITYGVFERLKTWTLGRTGKGKLSVSEAFWLGVGSKTLATIVTYPYIFAKVRLQAKSIPTDQVKALSSTAKATVDESHSLAEIASHEPDPSALVVSKEDEKQKVQAVSKPGHPSRGAIPLLMTVYRENGFLGWYQGLTAQIIKAVLCQGILFVSKDQFEAYAWIIMTLIAKLRARIALR